MKRANFFGTRSSKRFFKRSTFQLALAAVFSALTLAATMVISIPIPATGGYINVGDTVIFTAAALFGPFVGGIAGGLGSMLADLILGYAFYAPFTFIIKGLEGVLCGFLGFVLTKKLRKTLLKNGLQLVSFILSGLLMCVGYFFVELAYYGIGGALGALPGNLIQAVTSVILASALLFFCKLGERVVKNGLPQNSKTNKDEMRQTTATQTLAEPQLDTPTKSLIEQSSENTAKQGEMPAENAEKSDLEK